MAPAPIDPLGTWRSLSFAFAFGVSVSLALLTIPVTWRTRDLRTWGALAAVGVLESAYLASTILLLQAQDPDARRLWATLSFLPMPMAVYLLWHLTLEVTGRAPRPRWRAAHRMLLGLALGLTVTGVVDLVANLGLVVRGVTALPGTLRHLVIVTGPVGASFFVLSLLFLAATLILLARAARHGEHPLWPVAVGALVFLATLANDVMLVFGRYDAPFLNHLGFLALYGGFTVCFGYAFVARAEMLRAANLELRQHRRAAVHSSRLRSMGTLAAFVAHELGNDLQTVESILAGIEATEGAALGDDDLDDLRVATRHMATVLRSLRGMSRDTTGDPMEPTPLPDVLRDALRMLAPVVRRSNVQVRRRMPQGPELPVLGRAPELMQVFLNLLGNAIDAVTGTPNPTVGVDLSAQASHVTVRVWDNGPGIPEAIADKIFTPFFTTKASGEGTGIGLAVVRQIVTDHGGTITLASGTPGTVMEVRLPLVDPRARSGPESERSHAEPPPPDATGDTRETA